MIPNDVSGILGAIVSFLLTLMVFSYLLGDNVLFRLAVHIFIGVAAGYLFSVVLVNVIIPRLILPLLGGMPADRLIALVPLVGALALFVGKGFNRLSGLGSPVTAFLVGVGAAVAVGGAVIGTLLPQVGATYRLFNLANPLSLLNGVIILTGAVATLAYFQFGVRLAGGAAQPGQNTRPAWLQLLAWVGQFFIALAFGAIFAGVFAASLGALIERLDSILNLFNLFFTPPV